MFSARWETAKNYVGKQSGHDSLRRRSHTSEDDITLAHVCMVTLNFTKLMLL